MRFAKVIGLALFILLLGAGVFFYRVASKQGRARVDWATFELAKVAFDEQGVPTLEGQSWERLIEAQGFVVASDRLWQMDLMRRSASGRIAEWFGANPKVLEWDEKRKREDWEGIANRAVAKLLEEERSACESFAAGVNRFIQSQTTGWSLEYAILGDSPEAWECRDTILILLSMVEDLTEAIDDEAPATVWRKNLTSGWQSFLFPQDHPWNKPVFGGKTRPVPRVPRSEWITQRKIGADEVKDPAKADDFFPGSNAWVYRSPSSILVANDPHLSLSVPQLWYPIRFRISDTEWAAGAAIPGIPGIVLGRNASVAWGFTNAKEDVDDLLLEEISPDGKNYLAEERGGKMVWKPIEQRPYTIRIRGGQDITGTAYFTHRGPLMKRLYLGEDVYSRQWIGAKPGMLGLPSMALLKAKDWASFNRAADRFPSPAQAAVFADVNGGIGIRVSGTGIKRSVSGLYAQKATEGEWKGFEPASKRPRLYFPPGEEPRSLSTANQRLWTTGFGEHWSSDLRQDRIQTVLAEASSPTKEDMFHLQRDTKSRFFKELLDWISQNAKPQNRVQEAIVASWKKWDGFSQTNQSVFAQAVFARGMLAALVLGRVRSDILPKATEDVPYVWKLQNAWEVTLQEPGDERLAAFGLKSEETAQWLLTQVEKKAPSPSGYSETNRWRAQHPFSSIPVLGRLFRVDEHPQVGYESLVRVERPSSGATTRLVWDLKNKDGGGWAFPVGQSGHIFSPYFTSSRRDWFEGKSRPIWAAH